MSSSVLSKSIAGDHNGNPLANVNRWVSESRDPLQTTDIMNNQPEELQQPNDYQLGAIWREVLRYVQRSGIHGKLFREYGDLITFNKTGACVRLRLFADSWLMRLNQQHLEKLLASAFLSADKQPKVVTSAFLLAEERAKFQAKVEENFKKWKIEEEKPLKNLIIETEAQLAKGFTKRGNPFKPRWVEIQKRKIESAERALEDLDKNITRFSTFKYLTLSDNFQVHVEIEKIHNYSPDELIPFQYRSLDGLLPFPLPSVSLSERCQLPNCPAVYFVLDGDSITNSRVLYVGQTVNLKKRWQNHNRWKQLKFNAHNLCLAWLKCRDDEVMRLAIEAAFIHSLKPELNESMYPMLYLTGWDDNAREKAVNILKKVDKSIEEKKIFVAILQELLLKSSKLEPLPKPDNWQPYRGELLFWIHDRGELLCRAIEIAKEKSEAEILLNSREIETIVKEKNLTKGRFGGFYVHFTELHPAVGLGGLSILEMIERSL